MSDSRQSIQPSPGTTPPPDLWRRIERALRSRDYWGARDALLAALGVDPARGLPENVTFGIEFDPPDASRGESADGYLLVNRSLGRTYLRGKLFVVSNLTSEEHTPTQIPFLIEYKSPAFGSHILLDRFAFPRGSELGRQLINVHIRHPDQEILFIGRDERNRVLIVAKQNHSSTTRKDAFELHLYAGRHHGQLEELPILPQRPGKPYLTAQDRDHPHSRLQYLRFRDWGVEREITFGRSEMTGQTLDRRRIQPVPLVAQFDLAHLDRAATSTDVSELKLTPRPPPRVRNYSPLESEPLRSVERTLKTVGHPRPMFGLASPKDYEQLRSVLLTSLGIDLNAPPSVPLPAVDPSTMKSVLKDNRFTFRRARTSYEVALSTLDPPPGALLSDAGGPGYRPFFQKRPDGSPAQYIQGRILLSAGPSTTPLTSAVRPRFRIEYNPDSPVPVFRLGGFTLERRSGVAQHFIEALARHPAQRIIFMAEDARGALYLVGAEKVSHVTQDGDGKLMIHGYSHALHVYRVLDGSLRELRIAGNPGYRGESTFDRSQAGWFNARRASNVESVSFLEAGKVRQLFLFDPHFDSSKRLPTLDGKKFAWVYDYLMDGLGEID